MKKFVPIIVLFLVLSAACKKVQVCNCTIYNGQDDPTGFTKMEYNATDRNAENICTESAEGFSANGGSYMVCYLED